MDVFSCDFRRFLIWFSGMLCWAVIVTIMLVAGNIVPSSLTTTGIAILIFILMSGCAVIYIGVCTLVPPMHNNDTATDVNDDDRGRDRDDIIVDDAYLSDEMMAIV